MTSARAAAPRRHERVGAEYLEGVLESYGFDVQLQSVPFTGTRNVAKVHVAERDAAERPQLADELVAERQDHRRRGRPSRRQVVYAGTGATAGRLPGRTAPARSC